MAFPGYCPQCDARIRLSETPFVGQRMICPECDHLLEVIRVDPLRFDRVWEELRDEPVRVTPSFDSAFFWTDIGNE